MAFYFELLIHGVFGYLTLAIWIWKKFVPRVLCRFLLFKKEILSDCNFIFNHLSIFTLLHFCSSKT